jgi:hypothetical protein
VPFWFWIIWVLLVALAVIVGFSVVTRKSDRTIDPSLKSGLLLSSYIGGLRWPSKSGTGIGNATVPLARLEICEWGIRLAASARLLRLVVPTWEVNYYEIIEVGMVKSPLIKCSGIRFRARAPRSPIVFWTSQALEILDRLQERGVSVDRSVAELPLQANE